VTKASDIMLERRNLIHTFDELRTHRIIIVCAPAGYGKTISVMQWLSKDTRAKAVFSVDEYDNNLAGFCERFCAILIECQPQNRTLSEIVLHPSFQNAPDEFSLRAVSALSSRKQAVLIIDDLHLIHSTEILQLLFVFIKRLPKNFQIVLITRYDLPPELSNLRIMGHVTYINAMQFLFTNKEIMALYKKRGNPITREQAKDIGQQTQGWAIGINALLLSGKLPTDRVYDYLDEFIKLNVWEKWDESTRNFMLCTSIPRKLTPELCEALTGMANSEEWLKELVQKGAFITQLQKGVYRYHHLFQLFLNRLAKERGEEFIESLLIAEGNWHLHHQMDFYSAIDCFIRCKYHEGIAKCFNLPEVTSNDVLVVWKLQPLLKHPEVQLTAKKYPYLLYLMAWRALVEGHRDNMISYMDEYYQQQSEIATKFPDYAYNIFHMRMMDFRVPLSQIVDEIDAQSDMPDVINPSWNISIHIPLRHRGIVDFSELALEDTVDKVKQEIEPRTSRLYGKITPILTESILAGILYEQNHLEKAYECALKANAQIRTNFFSDTKLCAMSILVCILDAIEEIEEAELVINSIAQMIEEKKAYHLSHNFEAFVVRRKIARGDKEAALRWLDVETFSDLTFWEIYAAFTTCRAFIITAKYDSAIILLEKILNIANAFNRPLDIVETRILLTIAYWKKNERFQNEAFNHLENAVIAAYPYSYVQLFVNDGAVLCSILYKLQKRIEQRENKNRSQIEFIKLLYSKTRNGLNTESVNDESPPIKFTEKQKTVIGLLYEGKKHREIASILGIKLSSLRSHIELIYKKLEVSNVEDAVTRIKALKILDV